MKVQNNSPEQQEWKKDERGRYYRNLGNGYVEYRPEIITTSGNFYRDELKKINEERNEAVKDEKRRALFSKIEKTENIKKCPFSESGQKCQKEKCGLFSKNACALLSKIPITDIPDYFSGRKCPFSIYSRCGDDCALYNNGCSLANFASFIPSKK